MTHARTDAFMLLHFKLHTRGKMSFCDFILLHSTTAPQTAGTYAIELQTL